MIVGLASIVALFFFIDTFSIHFKSSNKIFIFLKSFRIILFSFFSDEETIFLIKLISVLDLPNKLTFFISKKLSKSLLSDEKNSLLIGFL